MLLSIVAGRQIVGTWKAGYRARSRCMVQAASNASQPPMISSPSTRCSSRPRLMAYRSLTVGTCRLIPSSAPPRLDQPSTSPHLQLPDVAVHQAAEAAADAEHRVATVQPEAHRGPGDGVHARSKPADVEQGDPGGAVLRLRRAGQGAGDGVEDVDHLGVAVAAHHQRGVVVPGRDPVGQLAGPGDALHQRRLGHPVVPQPDQLRDALWGGREHLLDGGVTEDGAHPPVEGAGHAAALHMPEDRHPDVPAQLAPRAPGARARW